MELTVKGRDVRVTDHVRARAAHKLAKLGRIDPRADRVELEIVSESKRGRNGTKRIEGTLTTPRRVLRASASASDLDTALDLLATRLERRVRDYRAKRKKRLLPAANRLKSPRIGPEGRNRED